MPKYGMSEKLRERCIKRMLRIAICDDEIFFAEELKELLSSYMMEKGLVFEIDTYNSGEELVGLGIKIIQYKIVFLDINMEKVDGITVAEKIRRISKEVFIVFVTAYMDYSLEGYRLDVVRYLLKGDSNFRSIVNECVDAIINKLNYSIRKKEFRFIEGIKEVSLERLIYVESNLHKLAFYVMEDDMKIYTMYGTLNTLESELAENNFIRIHQSYLINIKHIKNVVRYKAVLTSGIELVIPKVRYTYVKKQFIAYQGEV